MNQPATFPIIEKLGGRDAVYDYLRETAGMRTKAAIRMWHQRGFIPPAQRLNLMQMADSKGVTFDRRLDFEMQRNESFDERPLKSTRIKQVNDSQAVDEKQKNVA